MQTSERTFDSYFSRSLSPKTKDAIWLLVARRIKSNQLGPVTTNLAFLDHSSHNRGAPPSLPKATNRPFPGQDVEFIIGIFTTVT